MSKTNGIIYAGELVSKFGIDMVQAYEVLGFMEDRNLIERVYEMNSNKCKCINGETYNTIMSIPDDCPKCKREIDCLEETIIAYKY